MAHHQGMTLVALAVVLLDGLPRRWGMADRRLAAVACLLHERVPREVAQVPRPELEIPLPRDRASASAHAPGREPLDPGASALPPTQLLSNGRYAVALRPNGAGWSRWRGADISRWRDDALRDAHGSFVYLRRRGKGAALSITQHPAPDPDAHYRARFGADHAVFSATWPDLRVHNTVWVSPEDDVEFRRVELWNTSAGSIELDVLSAFEICLSEARADEMHPAFANLFVSARWDAERQALFFTRKPRRDDEPALHGVHFVAGADASVLPARAQADRARWRGRLRGPWQPLAEFGHAPEAVARPPMAWLVGGEALTVYHALRGQRAIPPGLRQLERRAAHHDARVHSMTSAPLPVADLDERQRFARIAGAMYLLTVATALFGEAYVRGSLLVGESAAATAKNLVDSNQLFRIGLATDLLTFAGVVVLVWSLYQLLGSVNRQLAVLAVFFRLVELGTHFAAVAFGVAALSLLGGGEYARAFDNAELNGLVGFALRAQMAGLGLGFIPLGLGSAIFALLLLRSELVPRLLAGWGVFASLLLTAYSFGNVLSARTSDFFYLGMLPMLVYEVSIGAWLLFKGVRSRGRSAA